MSSSIRCLILPLFLSLLSCASANAVRAEVGAPPIHLTVVGSNDLHGWIEPHEERLRDGARAVSGGSAAFAGDLSILRAQDPGGVILLSAGDLFQGTLISNLSEGAPVIAVLNRLGYVATAVGNHEFDYGPLGPRSVPVSPEDDPFGALKARIAEAHFPFLAANIAQADGGGRPSWLGNDGTLLRTFLGVRVGIIGLATPSTPKTTNPIDVRTLRFEPLAASALAAAKRLRARGAEVVIAIAHAGGRCTSLANPRDLSSCDPRDGEIFDLLDRLPPGTLDAVVAGHTHAPIGHFVNGTPVIETPGLGRAFGVIDLYVDPSSHRVLPARTEIHADLPICEREDATTHRCDGRGLGQRPVHWVPATFRGQPVVADPSIAALIAPYRAKVAQLKAQPLGVEVVEPLGRNYEAESALGDLVSDSLRGLTRADVAFVNSGGLRADLPAGPLTFGEVYSLMPFDNQVATIELTGAELLRMLAAAYGGHQGMLQESGLRLELSRCPGPGRLLRARLADGRPIVPGARYRVALPDFLALGGGGLEVMKTFGEGRVELGPQPRLLRDALSDYWRANPSPLRAPATGRIVFTGGPEQCPR